MCLIITSTRWNSNNSESSLTRGFEFCSSVFESKWWDGFSNLSGRRESTVVSTVKISLQNWRKVWLSNYPSLLVLKFIISIIKAKMNEFLAPSKYLKHGIWQISYFDNFLHVNTIICIWRGGLLSLIFQLHSEIGMMYFADELCNFCFMFTIQKLNYG